MGWTLAARADEVTEGKVLLVTVAGKEIGLYRHGDAWNAVLNFCPHSGAPVCRGRVEGRVLWTSDGASTYDPGQRVLRCPWHHWEFDLDTGAALAGDRRRLKTYPVKVEGDEVWVDI